MKARIWVTILVMAVLPAAVLSASPYKEDEEEQGHFTSPTYRYFGTRHAAETAMHRDIKFTEEMGRHHQGAVDMSQAYLHDPRGTDPFLQHMAHAIIYNQEFEIGWLEDVRKRVSTGPESMLQFGGIQMIQLPGGLTGLEHRARFQRAPVLRLENMFRTAQPSNYDVMFAKAMKMHHQMGVDMAYAYNNDPAGGNLVIREINRGIIRDQLVEIGILSDIIAHYPGDPDKVEIEPEMHEMMGMPHGH